MIFVGDSWWYVVCRDRIVESCFDGTERVFEFLDVEGRFRVWFRIGQGGVLMNLIQTELASAGLFPDACLIIRRLGFDLLDGWTKNQASTMASYNSDRRRHVVVSNSSVRNFGGRGLSH